MLQPRRYTTPHCFGYFCVFILVFVCNHLVHTGNAEEFANNKLHNGERFRRHDGDVTVLSLEENVKSPRALGVLSSTARTFVQAGTTTEFTTQVLGTTLGTTYARLLSTGSRVFYDNSPRPKPTDAFLVFPTVLPKIPLDATKATPPEQGSDRQTQSLDEVGKVQEIADNYNKLTLDDLFDLSDTRQNVQKMLPPSSGDERENVVSVRKEYSVKRNSDIKPANVIKSNNDLPTFTVRHEFAPSGFSLDDPQEKKEDTVKPGKRNGKALFRGGIPVKQEKKLDTVTYFGFADFTTTVGDTVIVFMPKTPDAQIPGAVTSITGEATLRPEDAPMPVVTSVKTFMSHSPGMATKTVTGHSLSMHTTLPTIQADAAVRESKAYEPVYVPQQNSQNNDNKLGINPSFPLSDYNDSIQPSIDDVSTDDFKSLSAATKPLSTFATTSTQVYNPAEDGLGLLKSIGGTEAFNGTTTLFTSFVFGTVIDGAYKQLIQSASSVLINVGGDVITTTGVGLGIAPSSASSISKSVENEGTTSSTEIVTTEENYVTTESSSSDTTQRDAQIVYPDETTSESDLSNEVDTPRKINSKEEDQTIVHDEFTAQKSTEFITRVVPSTVYKTFTYLTTFFIPDDSGGQTTSIKSREVTSTDITYVTKVVDSGVSNSVSTTIAPSEFITESVATTTPQEVTTVTEDSKTDGTTPQIPITSPDITTVPMVTTTEDEEEDDNSTPTPTTPKVQEEEVELIFKTLYTTYTYLTTFFQESSSSVSSREVVVTNVVTTTLDNAFASDPAVAGLFTKGQSTNYHLGSDIVEPAPTSVGIGRPTTKYFDDSASVDDDSFFASTLESVDVAKELQSATPSLDSVNEINEDGYKTFYTTYTYFTTVFVDGETEVESRTEVYTNVVTPSGISDIKPTSQVRLFSSDYVSVLPDEQVESPEEISETNPVLSLKATPTRIYDKTISRAKVKDNEIAPASEAYYGQIDIQASNVNDAYKYDTTMSRGHHNNKTSSFENDENNYNNQELSKEEKILLGITPSKDSDVLQTIVVDVTSSSSGGSRKVYRESYDDPDDQITSESNTEEIEPSFSPTILLQTSYTTFTYFTTVYKGTTSDVISRLDTVTNVVTETLGPSDIEESLSPEEATLPITYFTTFTYWTTLYKDGSTMVTSREETVSNIVTPTVEEMEWTESLKITPTTESSLVLPTVLTSIVGENSVDSTLEPKQLDSSGTDTTTDPFVITPSPTTAENLDNGDQEGKEVGDKVDPNKKMSSSSLIDLEPTTFYTTYTYFTTSYIGNSTVLNSRLETVTNIVTPTADISETLDVTTSESSENKKNDISNSTQISGGLSVKPTGLISTIRTSEVNNGITTLLSTDVFGTYIDGLYAQILESSTQIVSPTVSPISTLSVKPEAQPTGIVSINEGKIVDADGISTTFFTTKAVGTYVDKLYAQVVESTSSVLIDEEKKTATLSLDPSTTVVGSKTYRTGLVRLVEGSIVKDKTTTFYESRVIGTLIDGRYAQIIESTSSFKVEMTPTPVPDISATSVSDVYATINPTVTTSTSPSPAVIESSIGDDSDQDNEDNDHEYDDDSSKGRGKSRLSFSSRKKTFTPVIRPFASRPRPTFLPKKKTGDVGSATTITRNAFTPTITATPAVKSSERGFGSSRNRFSGGRRSSSSNAIQATASASTGRRFSGRRGSASASVSQTSVSQSNYRGRSSGRISPTASVSFGSSSRRGSFNYRTSSAQRSSSSLPGSSRFRIRPTASAGPGRPLQTVSSTTEDAVNTNDIGGTTVVTEDSLYTVQDEEHETSPPITTTESPRRSNNPLLRFRRPPILQPRSTTTTTPKPSTTPARRSSLLRRPDSRGTATTPLTPTRNRPVPTFPPRNRQRPSNSLFPPRGLLRKPTPAEEAEEKEKEDEKFDENEQNEAKLDEENDFADNDYEGSEHSESQHSNDTAPTTTELVQTERRGKALNTVQIRPFQGFRRPRTKRQAVEYGARRYQSRYQRPTARTTSIDYYVDDSEPLIPETPTTRAPSRYTPRSRGQTPPTQPRVRPTKASASVSRSQFTLRDKSSSQPIRSDYKRPSSRRRTSTSETTTVQRPKPPRLRTQTTSQQDTSYTSRNSGRRFTSRGRSSTRSRYRDSTDFDTYSFSPSSFDGTITVTHQVPTEVTIPVVNGKVTEYKNVITAKPSLEILGPHQYTTATGKNGNIVIQLTSEITSTLPNGAMEVTRFLVYETPTTSITFTPTTLRGRKTSFSHIVPSTVYDVRQEVSTVQPDIAANAPLANLLLSQLLLGNLNLQPNPQQINPLLGLQNQQIAPPTPTTEYKTKTTTYVTTVTDHTSTVLPLTFRGKEILTTIVDSSTQVITATEYLTETVVVTPTAAIGNNPQQINSLLLPALLQAQLLSPPQPTINPLLGTLQQQIIPQDILNIQEEKLQVDEPLQRFVSRRRPIEEEEKPSSVEVEMDELVEQPKVEPKTRKKVKSKNNNKKSQDSSTSLIEETSVITLYVSGRRPGDFSTILSTVTLGEESSVTLRKREAEYIFDDLENYKVETSKLPELGSSFSVPEENYLSYYVMSALNEVPVEESEIETQSLESIVGDVSKYLSTDQSKLMTEYTVGKPSKSNQDQSTEDLKASPSKLKKVTGHFLSKSPAETAPDQRKGLNFDWSKVTVKNTDDSIFLKKGMSVRVKRQIENTPSDQPRRKRVKVRVPLQRRVNIDEDLTPSEAQRSHDFTHQELLQTQNVLSKLSDFGTKKIKVIRKRPKNEEVDVLESSTEPSIPARRRIAVRRRRPIPSDENENDYNLQSQTNSGNINSPLSHISADDLDSYPIQPSGRYNQEMHNTYSTETISSVEPGSRRRKVLVTRRRPVPSPSSVEAATKRRVKITKKRPIPKSEEPISPDSPATIFSNFFLNLQTDYDYENPSINSNFEQTLDDTNYNDEQEGTEEDERNHESENNGFIADGNIDSIDIPSLVPDNQPHLSYNPFISTQIQNTDIPESIVWFYEPTDGIIIDITPTATEALATETPTASIAMDNPQIPVKEVQSIEDQQYSQPLTEQPEIEQITETEDNTAIVSNSQSNQSNLPEKDIASVKPEIRESSLQTSPIQTEEPLEFEDPPKFVRPTRSSVTRKPSRTITGYPGTRRRNPSSTLVSTSLNPSYESSDRVKELESSIQYTLSSSQNSIPIEIKPTKVEEPLNTLSYKDANVLLTSNIPLEHSMTDDLPEQSSVTPALVESSLLESSESGTPKINVTPTSYLTTVVTSTRLRTYTYVVTRVSGSESIVTSSTSVKPATKTLTLTIPVLAYTNTATALDEGRAFQLATKKMSNGVEVIVAEDRTTMPGQDILRKLPSGLTRPITLAPSTLTDTMMMLLPQDSDQETQELVTKTYLTTYTYRTTLLEGGETVVSSREEVVSNVVTEERRPSVAVTPTPVTKVTLTSSPSLATGVFHTTYTYLNTLVDGEVPLVLTSRRTVANTVTAPEDLLQPSEPPGHDTNTYLNTVSFTKTLADGLDFKIVSTEDVMTQVIITESDNKASSVEIKPTALTTDVVKTYFVTYTYFSTMLDGEDTVVHSEVATSSDVVTEKFVVPPKRTTSEGSEKVREKITSTKGPAVEPSTDSPINVLATKTYLTTFTYFTTLLQDNSGKPSTIVSSRTNVVQNIVTETLNTDLLDSEYLSSLRSSLQTDGLPIITTATLNDGQKMEITAFGEQAVKQTASPSHELSSSFEETSSNNNVITGSTIIFFDENDQIDSITPSSSRTLMVEVAGHTKINQPTKGENQETTDSNTENLQSEFLSAAESQALTLTSGESESEESQQSYETSILASSTITKNGATIMPGAQVIKFKDPSGNVSIIPVSDPVSKHPDGTHAPGTNSAVSNLLSLGSLGINSLNALGPVINAMAGLIKSNLKSEHRRRNDTIGVSANEPSDVQLKKNPLLTYAGPKPPPVRSPIYIPVGGLAVDSVAEESQNLEGHNVFPDTNQRNKPPVIVGRPTMESPLLAGGIPISPGQVITANSDVIIGKPAVHGPRPPVLDSKPYRKDDIPIGMKPPPPPKRKPIWPVRDHTGHYIPLAHHPSRDPPHRQSFPRDPPYNPMRDHLQNYDTINFNPEFFKHPEHLKKHPSVNNNRPLNHNEFFVPPPRKEPSNVNYQSSKPYYPTQQNIPVYNNIPNNNFDVRPTVHSDTEAFNSISSHTDYVSPIQHAPILLPDNTDFVDQSSVNPLLVNIQPSQVANVIIPHGSSTALIYSGEHSQKGEIFNDPSPYPDAVVDHVVDALSTARPAPEGEGITHEARVPINTNNLDVPVAPHGINVAAGNQQVYKPDEHSHQEHRQDQHDRRPTPINSYNNVVNKDYYYPDEQNQGQNYAPGLGEYLKPPPPPPSHSRPNEDEYVFGDELDEQEGGEVIQESNPRPLRPGQLPTELTSHPSTSMPIDPIDDDRKTNTEYYTNYKNRPDRLARPEGDINFSVVNSKPVQLDSISSINNQAPIINGRPGVNQFTDKSQATLAVGSPTKLKPDGSPVFPHDSKDKPNDRPVSSNFFNPALFAAIGLGNLHEDKPMIVEPVYSENKKQPKPVHDNTVETMNLDEKPPLPPMYETPPPPQISGPTEGVLQGDIPRPFSVPSPPQSHFDRNSQHDDSVVGLSPPPPAHMYPTHDEASPRPVHNLGNLQRRPVLPQRKPKPPPPYKFEIPQPPPNEEPPRSTLPPKLEPQRPPMLPETLSPPPPKPEDEYFHKSVPKRPASTEKPEPVQQWPSESESNPIIVQQQDSINPVLKGVLTVEEHSQQPEVITADSKVVLTNVINGHRLKPEGGIKITGSQPSLQTVVVGKPVPVPVTDIMPDIVIKPTAVENTKGSGDWKDGFIVGSETILDENPHYATPVREEAQSSSSKSKTSSVLVTTGVTTIYGNLFTRPSMTTKVIKPTKTSLSHHSVISVIVEPRENQTKTSNKVESVEEKKDHHKIILTVEGPDDDLDESNSIVTAPPPSTFVVTHTQTTTVTETETTVVRSKGQEPSTHTLVVTKTQTSTILDTVTEVHTLVKQTSILSTVTTTIPQVTSTVYTGTIEPDEYQVYPQGDVEVVKHEPEDKHEDKPAENPHDNESIFVVMTDKKSGMGEIHTVPIPDTRPPPEIQVPDETNEISPNVLLGNVFTHHSSDSECRPECKASRNELCQKIDNVMRCVCRPGFARMFPDRPCKPTYTYTMRLVLDRYGKNHIRYEGPLEDPSSGPYQRLVDATREGLDRMVMQSDLRDIYHGVEVRGFEPARVPDNAVVKFYVQLSDNTEESRLQEVLRKSLRSNNYSLGGTEVYAAKDQIQYLLAEDFDECTDTKFHDCSEDAQCFNLRGTYTCSCKEGFTDLSPNTQYPGRLCSAEQIGCEKCNFHGTCYSRNDEEIVCECFQWYGGATCQINLKVLLLILVTVGVCLVVLLVVCCVLACMKRREAPVRPGGGGFRRYRSHAGGTGDKRSMISPMGDTSSETSVEATPPAYIKQATMSTQRQKVLRKATKGPAPVPLHVPMPVGSMEQRDRSLTVMIPRAKYRPAPAQPSNTLLTMSTFGPSEQKLLNYLSPDTPGRNTPDKQGSRNTSRKPSNSTTQSEQVRSRKPSSQPAAPRKPSTGALVSAGFEVSATVGRTKELDEAFLEPHTDLSQPQFNTIRTAESCIIVDIPPPPTLEAELEDIITKVDRLTVSEARSYDETTIHPPTKSLHRHYDSKRLSTSSHRANDEGHTMVERDIGSTFMMPQTQLFKTDRQGSDISNFDSL